MSKLSHPELSVRNPYHINKERYYELKHFCRQYDMWKKTYRALDRMSADSLGIQSGPGDPTGSLATKKALYATRIKMVEDAAQESDGIIGPFVLIGVTTGMSYEVLNARFNIPCCKDIYYETYRRFFWILSQERD